MAIDLTRLQSLGGSTNKGSLFWYVAPVAGSNMEIFARDYFKPAVDAKMMQQGDLIIAAGGKNAPGNVDSTTHQFVAVGILRYYEFPIPDAATTQFHRGQYDGGGAAVKGYFFVTGNSGNSMAGVVQPNAAATVRANNYFDADGDSEAAIDPTHPCFFPFKDQGWLRWQVTVDHIKTAGSNTKLPKL
mmetsp:Transcript_22796/g.11003  ORF Transcript_22796/g.11003 Transcript_22796/m.11003 type:complete len:187 (-) Transcript_22796:4-564(-)